MFSDEEACADADENVTENARPTVIRESSPRKTKPEKIGDELKPFEEEK